MRILAALARVGAGAEAVHPNRQRPVRLRAQGPERHRRDDEPSHDGADRLHLRQRHGSAEGVERHQVAHRRRRLGVHTRPVGRVVDRIAAVDRLLQRRDQGRVEGVRLTLLAVADQSQIRQLSGRRRVRLLVAAEHVRFDLHQTDPAEPGRRAHKVAVDQLASEADRLKDLRAPVARGGGDPHLGGHLEQPVLHRLDVVALQVACRQPLEAPLTGQSRARGQGQVRVRRRRAVADQQREAVDIPDLARVGDEVHLRPQPLPNQIVVNRARGEQHRHRGVLRIDATVAENKHAGSGADRRLTLQKQPIQRRAKRAP